MIVFRLSNARYSGDLSGKGAEKTGGRWNNKGVAMVYTSASRALCTTEIAVHTPLGNIPRNYELVTIHIPDQFFLEIKDSKLPKDWKSFPYSHETQKLGDEFISKRKFLVMKVPSAVIKDEFNFLINPGHFDFHKVKIKGIEPFTFDKRLFIK